MGRPTTVASPGKRVLPAVVAITLFLPLLFAGTALAADLSLSSKTYGLAYERELAGGQKDRYVPLYEYLSADAANLGGKPLSFHFYGWGRVDLGENSGSGSTSGEVGSIYLEYLHPEGNAQAKLGRFFLTEGSAMEIIDGAFVKATTPSRAGGFPLRRRPRGVLHPRQHERGRFPLRRPGILRPPGVRGDRGIVPEGERDVPGGKNREMYGGDLWLRVAPSVELTGQATYNRSVSEMASQRYAVRIVPGSTFDISAGYESYTYRGLFQPALNPAFVSPSVNPDDKVQTIFGIVDWAFVPGWTLEVAGKNLRHDKSDPGDANRGEVGVRYTYNDKKDVAGFSAAFVSADQAENEYQEYRGFASYSPSKLRVTLDALTQQYKEAPIPQREEEPVPGGRHGGVPAPRGAAALRQPDVHAKPQLPGRLGGVDPGDLRFRDEHGREEMMRRSSRREHPRGGPARPDVRLLRRSRRPRRFPRNTRRICRRGGSTASSATRTCPPGR